MAKFTDSMKALFGKKSTVKKNDWAMILKAFRTQEQQAEMVEKLIEIFPFSMEEASQLVERTPIVLFENLLEELAHELERYFTRHGIDVLISNDPKVKDGCFQVDWPTPPRFDFLADQQRSQENLQPPVTSQVQPTMPSSLALPEQREMPGVEREKVSPTPFSKNPNADDFIADLYRELERKSETGDSNDESEEILPEPTKNAQAESIPPEKAPFAGQSGSVTEDELEALFHKLEGAVEITPDSSEDKPETEEPLEEMPQPDLPASIKGETEMPEIQEKIADPDFTEQHPKGHEKKAPILNNPYTEDDDIETVYKDLEAALGESLDAQPAPSDAEAHLADEGIDQLIKFVGEKKVQPNQPDSPVPSDVLKQIEHLREENLRLTKEVQFFKGQEFALDRADKEIAERESRLERQGAEVERLRLEILAREEKGEIRAQNLLRKIAELEDHVESIKSDYQKTVQEKEALAQQATQLQKAIDDEKERFEQQWRQTNQTMDERVSGYEEDKKRLQSLLEEKGKRVDELLGRIDILESSQGELADLKRQRVLLETELREMRESFELRLKQTENIAEEKSALFMEAQQNFEQLAAQKAGLEEKLNLVTSKVKQIVTLNRTLAQEKETLSQDMQHLKTAYDELTHGRERELQENARRLQTLQRQLDGLAEEKEQWRSENAGLRDQVKLLTQERERLDLIQKRTEYQAKVRESEEQLKGIRQNRDIYLKEIEEKQHILDELVSKQKDIESSLQEASQREKYILELLTKKDKNRMPGRAGEGDQA